MKYIKKKTIRQDTNSMWSQKLLYTPMTPISKMVVLVERSNRSKNSCVFLHLILVKNTNGILLKYSVLFVVHETIIKTSIIRVYHMTVYRIQYARAQLMKTLIERGAKSRQALSQKAHVHGAAWIGKKTIRILVTKYT